MSGKYINVRKRKFAKYRVFAFPWAGGGSSHYARWDRFLPDHLEIYGVRLQGRETRQREPPNDDLPSIIKDLAKGLLPLFKDKPFIFYGHSYGAILSFELTKYLMLNHHMQPEHIVVSGTFGPFSKLRESTRHEWVWHTEEEFVTKLKERGSEATPPDFWEDESRIQSLLPIMKADVTVCHKYGESPCAPPEPYISCPISFFDGDKDNLHPPEEWSMATSNKNFYFEMCPGGHFFILEEKNARKICDYIAKKFPAL